MMKLKKTIEYLFYLFVFLLPWQTRLIWQDAFLNGYTWEYGRFSLYGTQILLWLILGLFLVLLLKTGRLKKFVGLPAKELIKPVSLVYWLAVLFILAAGVSIFWALDKQLAYYRWFVLVQSGGLLALVVNLSIKFRNIALVWVGSSIVQGVFAIGQFLTQYVFANKWLGLAVHFSNFPGAIILQTQTERWLRAYGSLPHPNVLAGFLLIGFFFLVYLAIFAKTKFEKIYVFVGLLTIIPGLFFSFSRSAWVALISYLLGFGLWLYLRKKKKFNQRFFQVFLIAAGLLSILAFNLSGPVITRLLGQEPLEVNSIQLRFTFTEQALNIIADNSWQGTGVGNYTLGVVNLIEPGWPGYYYQPVHNIYLLVFAEVGLVGFTLFSLMILLFLWFGLKRAGTVRAMTLWLSFVAILVISLFDHYFWSLEFGVLIFWLILGLNIRQLKRLDSA